MRDIRFRIYDKSKKKMFYKTLIGIWGNWEDVKDDENYTSCAVYDERWKHVEPYMDDIELMQFTGLYDKNKVPIYEGDIVELDDEGRKLFGTSDSLCEKYQVVGFHDGAFMTNRNKHFPDNYDTYLWILKNYIVVIGNIYENSNLLGE